MRIVLIDTAFLGDLFLATPLIRAAAERATSGSIDLMTSPAGDHVTARHPLVSSRLIIDKRGPDAGVSGFRRARAWLRERRPDVALLPRRSLRSALLALAAGVPRRIGFDDRASRFLMTDRVPFLRDRHQVDRNLELLRPLGVDPSSTGLPGHPLEAFADDAECRRIDAWLAERRIARGFVALAPGSVWETKRWPSERFAGLAGRLATERDVVIIGGPGEKELARTILADVAPPATDRLHDASDLWTPTGTVYLLRGAGALVSNDSGAVHIGQAAGAPIVELFGPTVAAMGYAARGDGHRLLGMDGMECRPCGRHGARRCPLRHWRCMLDLSELRVEQVVRDLLKEAA